VSSGWDGALNAAVGESVVMAAIVPDG
jgi:hypothetical protein